MEGRREREKGKKVGRERMTLSPLVVVVLAETQQQTNSNLNSPTQHHLTPHTHTHTHTHTQHSTGKQSNNEANKHNRETLYSLTRPIK